MGLNFLASMLAFPASDQSRSAWRRCWLLLFFFITFVEPASAQALSQFVARDFADYRRYGPHAAFAVAADGKSARWYAAREGEDPSVAVARTLARCLETSKSDCTLYAVNNIVLNGRDWRSAMPPTLPAIGRLRPQPWWQNSGPQAANGLVIVSHGYKHGADSTSSPPHPHVGRFLSAGYDLYRFDRRWTNDWASDAGEFASAIGQARSMGYRRIILDGQSNGGFQSLAGPSRGARVDGIIAVVPGTTDEAIKLRDLSKPRAEFESVVGAIAPGPRVVLLTFPNDIYDIGGRPEMARAAFARSGVESMIIDSPPGFSGHGAANDTAFARKYGQCLFDFIESGKRAQPCP